MGFPQGDDLVQGTNPYYRTTYALITKQGSGLEDVTTLEDARLKGKHIGIIAGTPPATNMAANGLMANAKPYPLMIDTRVDSSAQAMIDDLDQGRHRCRRSVGTDGGLLRQEGRSAAARHAAGQGNHRAASWSIASAWASGRADQNWKRQLNRLIQENQPARSTRSCSTTACRCSTRTTI